MYYLDFLLMNSIEPTLCIPAKGPVLGSKMEWSTFKPVTLNKHGNMQKRKNKCQHTHIMSSALMSLSHEQQWYEEKLKVLAEMQI